MACQARFRKPGTDAAASGLAGGCGNGGDALAGLGGTVFSFPGKSGGGDETAFRMVYLKGRNLTEEHHVRSHQ